MVHGTHTYIHTPIHIYIYIINIHVHTHIYTMHTTHTCQCTKVLYTTNSDIKNMIIYTLYIIQKNIYCTVHPQEEGNTFCNNTCVLIMY